MANNQKQSNNIQKWLRGDWNVECDICDSKKKRSQCSPSYLSGDIPCFIACNDGCVDQRHPCNDPPPVIFDMQPVPDARPPQTDQFIVGSTTSPYRIGKFMPMGTIGFCPGGAPSTLPKQYIGLYM